MLGQVLDRAMIPGITVKVFAECGLIRPHSPLALAGVGLALRQYGMGVAGGFKSVALLFPDRIGIIDELGELTFGEIERRSNALAGSLAALGVGEGDGVAIMARNHRGFLDAVLATAKLGADALFLNTAFAAPQIGEVCGRERPAVIVHDQEFTPLVDAAGVSQQRVLAWVDDDPGALPTLEALIEQGSTAPRTPPSRQSRAVILTSGTTGTPKGAARGSGNLGAAVALLSRMPLRAGWRTHVAAPLFHTWGWANLSMAMLLGSTCVLTRRFDPEECLRTVQRHRCQALAVIPVMLQRTMRLPEQTLDSYDLSRLRVVAASGSELPGDLAERWMDQFGDNLYNLYGSTEVAWVSIATPRDLRAAPGTAGKPPVNTVVRLYDDQGEEVPPGGTGRIFVGNSMLFEGYTGGGHKERIDGLMSSGDVGRFDREGRLFVEGRDDEMIVSGGENVFPQEVEDVLSRHPAVHEAAAVGVADDEFGTRLRAFVVLAADGPDDVDRADEDRADEDRADEESMAETLKAWVRDNLARYKVPREFVFVDELPRNATGKILRRELAAES